MRTTTQTAFSLLEILIAISILTTVLGVTFAALRPVYERARATALLNQARGIETAVRTAILNRTLPEPLPITRYDTIPVTGSFLPTCGGNYAAHSFEPVLFGLKLVDGLKQPSYGAPEPESWAQYIKWDTAANAFNGDTMPAPERAALNILSTWPRRPSIQCILSNNAMPPGNGGNFWLSTAGVDLPAGARVLFWRLPDCPQALAEALANAANPPSNRPDSGAISRIGPVTYNAPINGLTTVHIYIAHFP